jgi:hypothetical protein
MFRNSLVHMNVPLKMLSELGRIHVGFSAFFNIIVGLMQRYVFVVSNCFYKSVSNKITVKHNWI